MNELKNRIPHFEISLSKKDEEFRNIRIVNESEIKEKERIIENLKKDEEINKKGLIDQLNSLHERMEGVNKENIRLRSEIGAYNKHIENKTLELRNMQESYIKNLDNISQQKLKITRDNEIEVDKLKKRISELENQLSGIFKSMN